MAPVWRQAASQAKPTAKSWPWIPESTWLRNLDTEHTAHLASCIICQHHLRGLQAPNDKPKSLCLGPGMGPGSFIETSSPESNSKAEMSANTSNPSVDWIGDKQAKRSEIAAEGGPQRGKIGLLCHTEGLPVQFQQRETLVSSGRLFSFSRPRFPSLFETLPFEIYKQLIPHSSNSVFYQKSRACFPKFLCTNIQFSALVKCTIWDRGYIHHEMAGQNWSGEIAWLDDFLREYFIEQNF